MRTIISLLLILSVTANAEHSTSPAEARSSAAAIDADCVDFINDNPPNVSCHHYRMPLDHDGDGGPTLELPVLIARANADEQADAAILIPGGGGPGSPIGFGYLYQPGDFLQLYEPLLEAGFDIVFTDQRGAGLAQPMLACEESVADFRRLVQTQVSLTETLGIQLQSTRQCRARLAERGIDPSLFDTRQSARDFLALVDALDYRRWHVLATSYATAIAQAMLAIHPEVFASVVLDSPVPLDYQQPLTEQLVLDGIRKTLARCSSRQRCARRYPDIEQKLTDTLARAAREPYKVKIMTHTDSGITSRKTLVVDHHLLASILFTALYSNDYIQQLPKVVEQLHSGLPQALNPFAEEFWYQGVDPDYADGLYLSVHCRERQQLEREYLRRNPDAQRELDAESLALLENQREMCRVWQAGREDTLHGGQSFAPPALILAGRLDPIISAADIANTADDFRRPQILREASSGHAVWYQSACARKKVAAFLTEQKFANVNCRPRRMRFD